MGWTRSKLTKMYLGDNLSIREIASKLKVGKTTVEYYLKKFNIPLRNRTESGKLRALKYDNWIKGLDKNKDKRVKVLANRIREAYTKKRDEKFKSIETKYGKSFKDVLNYLYWERNLSQEEIAKELKISRNIIIKLMKEFNLKLRPKYQYISSLKGKDHSMFGKKWENFHRRDDLEKRRKEAAERFRRLTIKRLQNNEFPFFDTKIERKIARELIKRNIIFVKQFNFENKFVCDIAIPYLKIIIECDGDYWHANPTIYSKENLTFNQKKNLQRDRFKDKFLEERGWTVLRFFESDIKNNAKKCMNIIEEKIKTRLLEVNYGQTKR